MRPVRREELLPLPAYERSRDELRAAVLAAKRPRRIHLGEHLTFLFENTATVRHQIQEMARAERLTREAELQHELDTYNELLGGPGELGATLLIELTDPLERADRLAAWRGLMGHLYLELEDGTRVRPRFDPRQVGEERLSSVQYLKFDVRGSTPVAVGADHPELAARAALTEAQREALRQDLATDLAAATGPVK